MDHSLLCPRRRLNAAPSSGAKIPWLSYRGGTSFRSGPRTGRVERGSADGGSVARALPAIDVEGLAGHEGGRFEIEDGVHDVGDLAHSAARVEAGERLMRLDGMHRRLDDAGSDRVHPDAALRVFDRQRPRGGIEASLRQGCEHGGDVRVRVVYQARRDLDDMAAAALLHLSDRKLRHVEESPQV